MWNDFQDEDFIFQDRNAKIVYPATEPNGKIILKTEYLHAFPNFEIAMLNRGYTLCFISHHSRWAPDNEIHNLLNEQCPNKPTSLMVLPFLQGMGGMPDVDARATGLVAGVATQTHLHDIYRAILEGVTFEMCYNQEKLRENGIKFQRLHTCSGAKSPVWLQSKADILGCPIIPVKSDETGTILGLAAVTGEDSVTIAKRFQNYGEPVLPNEDHARFYNQRYEVYKALCTAYRKGWCYYGKSLYWPRRSALRVEEVRLVGGKGDGMRLLQVCNAAGLEMTISADRCTNISRLIFKGDNMVYFSPNGYVAPAYYDQPGTGFLKSFTAGFLTTCGLTAVGSPCTDAGEDLPLHGTIGNTPL